MRKTGLRLCKWLIQGHMWASGTSRMLTQLFLTSEPESWAWKCVTSEQVWNVGRVCIKEKSNLHLALKCFLNWYLFDFSFPSHPNHIKSAEQIFCSFYRWEKESPERLKKKNCLEAQQPWLQELGPKFGSSHTPLLCYKVANQKSKQTNHQSLSKSLNGKVAVAILHFATA